MKLVAEQNAFLCDVAKLIQFADNHGTMITGGELFRPQEMQDIYVERGLSKAKTGNHQRRLAIDLNFFVNENMVTAKEDLQIYGDYWEKLNPGVNRWGGNFKALMDTPHFERNI